MTTADATSIKLSDLAYAKIAGRIRSGDYPIGARLPPENELAETLGVSRPVVREALARLRDNGVVVSRRGSGTYVRQAMEPERGTSLQSIADMRRCLIYRISLEGEAAHQAALGSDDDRGDLRAAMARLEVGLEAGRLDVDDDFAFHLGVATATGNRFFVGTMAALRTTIVTAMGITPSFQPLGGHDRVAAVHREHRRVFDAIGANDPEAARTAMRDHLGAAIRRVFDGL